MRYEAEKGFYKQDFLEWLYDEFPSIGGNSWTRELVENIIEYGQKHERVSKDMFVYWLSNMLPEVEFLEAARFMEIDCLTDGTLQQLIEGGNYEQTEVAGIVLRKKS